MPTAEARIATRRATRYLTQLCSHTAQVRGLDHQHRRHQEPTAASAAGPPIPRHAGCSDTDGFIAFDSGRCTLRATTEELMLRVEADDLHTLELIKEALTTRIQRIGHRDHLAVTWTSQSPELSEPDPSARRP